MDGAFRHFRNCRLVEGATNPRTISTNILNFRAFKRHFRQACKIESRHALTIIDTVSLPPKDAPHVEPSYS